MTQQLKTKKPLLKICGVTVASDVATCLQLGVDYVGFNLYSGSKRYIAPAQARLIWLQARDQHQASTLATLVIVDHTPEQLATALVDFPEARVVQVHNVRTTTQLGSLRAVIGDRELWAGVAVHEAQDMDLAAALQTHAALVLLDAAVIPMGSTVAGGSGHTFDWSLLAKTAALGKLPRFGIAGGLNDSNLPALAAICNPQLLDVCSGVETAPGKKDPTKIATLIQTMRSQW
ncbi:MAG: phosphoribosylanthranilate isomerase [Deltaproteobacteria bacterium]|nr:phosphoribosylanthranilate isomerase [Deltaproteobacteria bacterium]